MMLTSNLTCKSKAFYAAVIALICLLFISILFYHRIINPFVLFILAVSICTAIVIIFIWREKRLVSGLQKKEQSAQGIFDQFFTNSPDLLCIAGTNGNFITLNPEWETTLGYSISELEGKSFLQFVHPDDIEITINTQKTAGRQKVKNFVNRYRHKNGSYRWIEWSSYPSGDKIYAVARDITRYREIEQNLKESEERNSLIASLTTDYVFKIKVSDDQKLKMVYASENFEKITGRSISESEDIDNWVNIFYAGDLTKVKSFLKKTLSDPVPGELECRSVSKGIIRWISIFVKPVIDPITGNVITIIGAAKDISARKEAEMQLRLSEEKFSLAFKTSPDAMIITRISDGLILDVSDGFESISGYAAGEIIGKTTHDFNLWVNPEDREVLIKEINGKGMVRNHEFNFRKKDGEILIGLTSASLINLLGEPCVLTVIRDITSLKNAADEIANSERRFRSIFENSTVGIAMVGLNGEYLIVNQALCAIMGYSTEELNRMNIYQVTHPDDIEISKLKIENMIQQVGDEFKFVKRYIHKNGNLIWAEVSSKLLYDQFNQPLYFITHVKDITEQKLAEEKIRINETRLKRAELASHSGNWELHLDSQKMFASEGAMKLYGVTNEELDYSVVKDIPLPEYRSRLDKAFKGLLYEGKPYDIEFKIKTADTGEIRDIHSIAHYDNDKRILFGVIHDITEYKKSEEKIRQLAGLHQTILDTLSVGILYVKDRKMQWANNAFYKMYGFDCDEIINKETRILYVNEKDYKRVGEEGYFLLSEGKRYSTEVEARHKDGRLFWINLNGKAINSEEPMKGSIWMLMDITDQMESESALYERDAKLRSIFRAAPVSIGLISGRKFTECNETFYKMSGYLPEEIIGKGIRIISPTDEEFERVGAEYNRQLSLKIIEIIETRWLRKDGALIDVLLNFVPVDYDDPSKGTTFTALDITGRKLAEEEIRKLNLDLEKKVTERTQKLNEAIKDLESFSYSISHDLRAPVRHINGFIRLLYSNIKQPSSEVAGYYSKIEAATLRMSSMIDSLLSFSRLGRKEMTVTRVNLDMLVEEVIALFNPDVEKRNIKWIIKPLGLIDGDKDLLKHVFENLISNAVKYTSKREKAEIEIGCKPLTDRTVEYYIRDNGIGFDMKYVDKLFGVFQRLHTSDEFEGNGIGLANVKQIIDKHGGKISAEGKTDEGATFYITLPKS